MSAPESSRRIRMLAAIVGGGAVVALGALTTAAHHDPAVGAGVGYFSKSAPTMNVGGEALTTTPEPTVLATEKAVPLVKAPRYGKS